MDSPELRLRCLELAMEQAKRENAPANRDLVAEIARQFYHHVMGETPATETPTTGKRHRGQGAEIFK